MLWGNMVGLFYFRRLLLVAGLTVLCIFHALVPAHASDADQGSDRLAEAKSLLQQPQSSSEQRQSAAALLREAAEAGQDEAKFLFAMLGLNNPDATDASTQELNELLCTAAENGFPPAIAECAGKMLSENRDLDKALAMLNEGGGKGNLDCLETLARFYARPGPRQDRKRSVGLWISAATQGSDTAKLELIKHPEILTSSEQRYVNQYFKSPKSFKTDVGRILVGNYYLSLVDRGQRGEYIEGEYWYYVAAWRAFEIVSHSTNKVLADQAGEIASYLYSHKPDYEKDLEARRARRTANFWIAAGIGVVAILSLSSNDNNAGQSSTTKVDRCAGIDGLANFGVPPGAIALFGCDPWKLR